MIESNCSRSRGRFNEFGFITSCMTGERKFGSPELRPKSEILAVGVSLTPFRRGNPLGRNCVDEGGDDELVSIEADEIAYGGAADGKPAACAERLLVVVCCELSGFQA